MSEISRKRRLAGRIQQLLKIAIEEKAVREGIQLGKLVMELNGWKSRDQEAEFPLPPERPPAPSPELVSLLDHLPEGKKND